MNKNKHAYDGKIAGLYDLEDTLGRGHFAVVKLARHVFTGEKVAVKVIDKTKLDEVSRAHLFQEVRCMKLVQHPNVVRLYEVIDTQTKLYLILELGDGGDMYDYIMKHEKGLDEETAKKYFRQIVHAISYCHRLRVVHRDLKPENVVFFEKLGMVKLTDFGFSNRFLPGQKLETSCGSLAYSAPEILLGDSYDAPAVDVWSLGVILFMLVCGQAPFQEANDSETLTMIMDCKYTIPPHVSQECKRLIQKMLIRDPEKRATLEQIATDPWLESAGSVQYADYLPLVSREHLSEEDHAHIIQKMINGNIAMQEEILEALDKNSYNHITATYFLLAERKLRALRQERAKLLNATHVSDLSALAISPRNPVNPPGLPPEDSLPRTVESLLSPQETRRSLASPAVPCTIESLQNCRCRSRTESSVGTAVGSTMDGVSVAVPSPRPLQRTREGSKPDGSQDAKRKKRLSADLERHVSIQDVDVVPSRDDGSEPLAPKSSSEETLLSADSHSAPPTNKFKPVSSPNNRKLHSVRSSPQLTLNEIYEEVESDGETTVAAKFLPSSCVSTSTSSSPATRVLKMHQSIGSPAGLRKFEQRRRYVKSRTASCSSSDASDEDTDQRKRKAEKLKRMPGWRDGRHRDGGGDDDDEDNGAAPGNNGNNNGSLAPEGESRGAPPPPPGEASDQSSSQHGGTQRSDHSMSELPPVGAVAAVCVAEPPRLIECKNRALLQRQQHMSVDELSNGRPATAETSSASDTSSPLLPASVAHSLVDSASPPASPLSTPNVTSLRQSQTLNQLNRFISPPPSLLSSPVLDVGDKENHALSRHCALANLRRPGKWRPPSYPAASSSAAAVQQSQTLPAGASIVPDVAIGPRTSHYKQGLYRLFKYAPHLGPKRWDINRNGLSGALTTAVGSPRAAHYAVGLRVASAPPSTSSHSKCCSLC